MSAADSLPDSIGNTKPSQPGLNVNGEPSGTDAEKPPLLEDVMQLARLGDVEPMRRLLDGGRFRADHKDHEGITPLHWAAINNHYAMCKFLIGSGADVNAKGGEAVATPTMWAAQRCNYYVVNLLLQHGADPLLTDAQGYNILHLATFDGNVFLLVLLLHQNISIDTPDLQGHTSLMWAAYKGYPACVDLFLRWGANVSATDDNGFMALHWALVKGSLGCIQKLIEYGADRFAETSDGKTPATVAEEMKSSKMWHQALHECGFDEHGHSKKIPLPVGVSLMNNVTLNRFYFLYPFFLVPTLIWILSTFPLFVAAPLAGVAAYALQSIAQRLLNYAPLEMRRLHETCIQIARAITTYESMRGLPEHTAHASETITAAITSGSLSMSGAQLPSGNTGGAHHGHAHREGFLGQWKKLLGLDAFVATAQSEINKGTSQRRRNPYSRGLWMNCQDFWCDPAPIFGKREVGSALLDGEVINYTR
ncbi:MAG: hypothetical protein LQ340_007601, partial [Diploschistes diacapsis]